MCVRERRGVLMRMELIISTIYVLGWNPGLQARAYTH